MNPCQACSPYSLSYDASMVVCGDCGRTWRMRFDGAGKPAGWYLTNAPGTPRPAMSVPMAARGL